MKAFGGAGVGRPETRAERARRAQEQAIRARLTIAVLSDRRKIELLAGVIVEAAQRRGLVCDRDIMQAGLSKADGERPWDDAIVVARAFYPAIDRLGTFN